MAGRVLMRGAHGARRNDRADSCCWPTSAAGCGTSWRMPGLVSAAGTGTLTIAQLVGAKGITPLTPWPWPGHVLVHGRVAALRVDQAGGVVFSCNITWVEHGYRFVVNSHGQVPLSAAQLTAVANGIRLRPGQDR